MPSFHLRRHSLFLPPAKGTRLLVFQKHISRSPARKTPGVITGHERDIKGQPFLGNDDARLQVLLPDQPAFDMAVNIFTYQPGATLPFVETHIMEHGLLMLNGQGVYRLDADHYPVTAGDVIWMASYCPQWFVAMGKTPRQLYLLQGCEPLSAMKAPLPKNEGQRIKVLWQYDVLDSVPEKEFDELADLAPAHLRRARGLDFAGG